MAVNKNVKLLFSVLVLLGFSTSAHAFSDKTHKTVTESAVLSSGTNDYLKNYLGISQGLECKLTLDQSILPVDARIPRDQFEKRILPELPGNPHTILDFLKAGASLEDVPMPRARHHFHAPIANPGVWPPNPNAGLDNKTDHPIQGFAWEWQRILWYWFGASFDLTGASALKRACETENKMEWQHEYWNYFSWPDTRNYFTKALTESSPAVRDHSLGFVRRCYTAQPNRFVGLASPATSRQDHIAALDPCKLLQQCSRRIAQTRATHPLCRHFPQHIRQEAHQDMPLAAVGLLVPYRTDHQFITGNPKGPLGLGQLNIPLPQGAGVNVGQIGPQQITALRQRSPFAPFPIASVGDLQHSLSL
jgi:hypothetical protein